MVVSLGFTLPGLALQFEFVPDDSQAEVSAMFEIDETMVDSNGDFDFDALVAFDLSFVHPNSGSTYTFDYDSVAAAAPSHVRGTLSGTTLESLYIPTGFDPPDIDPIEAFCYQNHPTRDYEIEIGDSAEEEFYVNYQGQWQAVTSTPDAVPEPSTMILLGTGLLVLAARLRTSKKR
jgi:hypothetical protein